MQNVVTPNMFHFLIMERHKKINANKKTTIEIIPHHPIVKKLIMKKLPAISSGVIRAQDGGVRFSDFSSLIVKLSGKRL